MVVAGKPSYSRSKGDYQVQRIAEELGVRYLLEGSIQKSGRRVRISARLVEGASGHRVWADRFDRRRIAALALAAHVASTVALTVYAASDPTAVWPLYLLSVALGGVAWFGFRLALSVGVLPLVR